MHQRSLPVLSFSLIALLMLFAPLKSAHADSGASDVHTTIDGYRVELVFPDGSPKAGPNTVLVRLHNTDKQPLSSAIVQVAALGLQSTGAAGHGDVGTDSHAGATEDAHADEPATDHAGAPTSEHGHSAGTSDSHTDRTPHELTHDEADQHIDTIMTQLEVGVEPGTYTGLLHFDSPGVWQVQIRFAAARSEHVGSFAVAIAEPARDWRILGAFGGANALIILTAGVL
ncbi:MAG TPA: hypothetical protein VFU22_24740, partial [Roseiflexaceae bacterium]|nr:hypothetical protein [Roseiflexaceae bacterium]